jgi:hypothetical protein
MSPRLSCCQIQSLVESFPSAIEGFGSIAISTSIVATESQPLVGCVLGAYPAYSSPIPLMYSSRVSRRAALARHRPLGAWTALDSLGQRPGRSHQKLLASLYHRSLSAFFVRCNQTISISPNKPQLNDLSTLSFFARHVAFFASL